jgi:hypothetical protein
MIRTFRRAGWGGFWRGGCWGERKFAGCYASRISIFLLLHLVFSHAPSLLLPPHFSSYISTLVLATLLHLSQLSRLHPNP